MMPVNFADQMDIYYEELRGVIGNATQDVNTDELRTAIDTFRTQAQEAQSLREMAVSMGDADLVCDRTRTTVHNAVYRLANHQFHQQVQVQNHKIRDFHRGFTSQGGLPTREFYRHLIFAPGLDTGYAPVTFPGVTEAIEIYNNFTMAEEWVTLTSEAIRVAGNILKT